jgi:hypothetical protein
MYLLEWLCKRYRSFSHTCSRSRDDLKCFKSTFVVSSISHRKIDALAYGNISEIRKLALAEVLTKALLSQLNANSHFASRRLSDWPNLHEFYCVSFKIEVVGLRS